MESEQQISWKAVLIGFVVDIGSSFAVSFVFGIILGVMLVGQGVKPDELEAEINAKMQEPIFLILSMVLGFLCTGIGGLVAARMARKSELLHGALVGVLSLGFGVVYTLAFLAALPLWYHIVAFARINM